MRTGFRSGSRQLGGFASQAFPDLAGPCVARPPRGMAAVILAVHFQHCRVEVAAAPQIADEGVEECAALGPRWRANPQASARAHALDDAAHRLATWLEVVFEEQLVGAQRDENQLRIVLAEELL